MGMNGYLEAVEPFQARGWVHDPAWPQRALMVEILLNGQTIGSVLADLHRKDLEQAGIGSGNHAFIYNFDQKLDPTDMAHVSARVAAGDGSFVTLSSIPVLETNAAPPVPPLSFAGLTSDSNQHPVFVLGAARSGTSAMAQALMKLDRFTGHQEGHLLDLLAHLSVALDKFYDGKADELAPGRDTTVSLVPREYFQSSLDELFIRTIRAVFPEASWIDKTPNSDMIHLAPRFLGIWPNSRFIFMKRRFLENAASRAVKFPSYDFSQNCWEWNNVMTGWFKVRSQLQGAAIEIDQRYLKDHPNEVAAAVQGLLHLTDTEQERLGQAFRYDYPERTSTSRQADMDISSMGWQQAQIQDFERACAETMAVYGYSTDSKYYRPGDEANGLVWI